MIKLWILRITYCVKRYQYVIRNTQYLFLITFLLASCGSAEEDLLPTAVPISNNLGEAVASQPGPLWVLLSGVDEHGLIAEHQVALLAEPDATADSSSMVHTGIAAAVHEIRQTGPQNLWRFYRVETVSGETGWIADYYIRRTAYLFNDEGKTVPLYADANGRVEIAQINNVTPIIVREPSNPDWWIVQTVTDNTVGWVPASFVKESPEPEFLLNQQHLHPQQTP